MSIDDSFSKALLHFDGADESEVFTDESGKTWLGGVFGGGTSPEIDTAQSKFGGASCLFDGTSDYIYSAASSDWDLDGGSDSNAWTIDFWARFNGDPGTGTQGFVSRYRNTGEFWYLRFFNNTLQFVIREADTTTANISNAWNPADATWYHVAFVKNGATGYLMFIDGTQIGTTQTDTSTLPALTNISLNVGLSTSSTPTEHYFAGWMDELRISKGVARWTANFTPPTKEYEPMSGFLMFF